MYRNFCIAICFLLIAPAFAGQPVVRGISFTALNKDAPTPEQQTKMEKALDNAQAFLWDQMERHGYGAMEFKIEEEEGKPIVEEIVGKKPLEKYLTNGSLKIGSIVDEIECKLDDFSKDGEIRVVFISDLSEIREDVLATYRDKCSLELEHGHLICRDSVFIPADSKNYIFIAADSTYGVGMLSFIVVHEALHACGLGHHPNFLYVMYKNADLALNLNYAKLSKDEARWLSQSKFLTGNPPVISRPTIDDVSVLEPERIHRQFNVGGSVKVRLKFENKFDLHQVYLLNVNDGTVLDYDYMDNPFNATFNVSTRYLRETLEVMVRILDKRGNFVYYTIDLFDFDKAAEEQFRVPAAPSLSISKTFRTWGNIKADR